MGRENLQGARLLLAVASLNAIAVTCFATLTVTGLGSQLRALLAGAVAVAYSAAAFRFVGDLPGLLARRPGLPFLFAGFGAIMLVFSRGAASTLLVAYMTPVGVCALLNRWIMGAATAAILGCGYAGSLFAGGSVPAAELALSNVVPGFIIVFGALVPIRLLLRVREDAVRDQAAAGVEGPAALEAEQHMRALQAPRGPVALLMPTVKLRRGRALGQRPQYAIDHEAQIRAMLRAPGPVPTANEIARRLGAKPGTVRAQLRAMRHRDGFEQHSAWVASLRAEKSAIP